MLEELEKYARVKLIPIVRPETRKLLMDTCMEVKPKRILEIGTAIGYSGALMLSVCEAQLVTLEKKEELYKLALQTFEKEELSSRVKALCGDAKDILPQLASSGERFDLVFLDGPKAQYVRYFPYLKELLNEGGVLFADDIYFYGLVKHDAMEIKRKKRSIVRNLQAFIETLKNDSDFETRFLEIEDGVAISRKKINKVQR